ncbi:MAG: hypothetical protein A4E53_04380 [Pelotomaculum sp. PtaB.Bin104]|nr:MAG: hypothetical protein A4E53_04380 [Pelotomaculum sp. PtaB.Bin104]
MQLNHHYCTHLSFSGDQAYFANWTEDIGLYKTNLADGKSEKLVGGRISGLCAGANVVFYMSEANNYQLAKLKPNEHSKNLFKISPFEMVACGDRLYFSLYGRPGIYLLDQDNKISKIYDLYASSFSVDQGRLYFLTSTIASAADDWTELPF